MVKEGEGGVKLSSEQGKDRSGLQRVTGQGKEVEGIKYPMPTPMTLAFVEEEFGSLESMAKDPGRHKYRIAVMLVFFLEMQKEGKLGEVAAMTMRERRKAASDLLEEKKIAIGDSFNSRAKVANEVFTSALGVKRVK